MTGNASSASKRRSHVSRTPSSKRAPAPRSGKRRSTPSFNAARSVVKSTRCWTLRPIVTREISCPGASVSRNPSSPARSGLSALASMRRSPLSISTAIFMGCVSRSADRIPADRPFSATSKSSGERSSTGSPVDRRVTSTNTWPSNCASATAGARQAATAAARSTQRGHTAADGDPPMIGPYCMRSPANSPAMRAPERVIEAEIWAPGGFGRS